MPKVIVQTDDGVTIASHEYPVGLVYAMMYMPGCPTNTAVHGLLAWLKRALEDAEQVQRHGIRSERLSERVMQELQRQQRREQRRE